MRSFVPPRRAAPQDDSPAALFGILLTAHSDPLLPTPEFHGSSLNLGKYPCCPLSRLIPRNVTIMAAKPKMAT